MSHVDEGTLHSYLDGELPASERAAVEAHLAQCAMCRATLIEERALLDRASALLGSARPLERPAPPFEQIRRAPESSPWRVRTSFAWAASIVLALGVGYYLRDPGTNRAMFTPTEPAVVAQDRLVTAPAPAAGVEGQVRPAAPPRWDERGRVATPPTDHEAAVEQRPDSAAPRQQTLALPEAVALKSAPQLRNVAPAREEAAVAGKMRDSLLALAESGITTAAEPARGVVAIRGRTATTQWQIISRGTARTLLGTDPVGLPGLATRRIRRSLAPDATVVVEQALDSATVIQIFQRPASPPVYYVDGYVMRDSAAAAVRRQGERAPAAAAIAQAPADRLARFVGRLRVEISGPLSPDSLNKLLEQVEPLP